MDYTRAAIFGTLTLMIKKILRNSSYLIVSQALTKVVAFFYALFLINNLTVEEIGLYSVALSYFSIIAAIADFGIVRYLIRELSKDNTLSKKILGDVFFLRVGMTGLLYILFSSFLLLFDPDHARSSLAVLAVLAVVPQAVAFSFDGVFVAQQKLKYSALGQFVLSISSILMGIGFVTYGFGPYAPVIAIVLAHVVYALFMLYLLTREGIAFTLSFPSIAAMKEIFRASLPYGLLGALGLIYFRIDMVMLSYMRGSYETGIYGTAYKFLEAIVFIPSAVSAAIFPVFSHLHHNEQVQIKKLYFQSMLIMGVLSVFVLFGFLFILPLFIQFYLPKVKEAIPILQILSFAIPFMFIHSPAIQLLLSTDKFLKPVILFSFMTLFFNIILNYFFINQFGAMGAAITTVASEILSFVIFFAIAYKRILRPSV